MLLWKTNGTNTCWHSSYSYFSAYSVFSTISANTAAYLPTLPSLPHTAATSHFHRGYIKFFTSAKINPQVLQICFVEQSSLLFMVLARYKRCCGVRFRMVLTENRSWHISSRCWRSSCSGIERRDSVPSIFSISSSRVLHIKKLKLL